MGVVAHLSGTSASACIPVEELARLANIPLLSANAVACAVVKDVVLVADAVRVHTLAVVVIPGEVLGASALKASAAAVGRSVVIEVANWAWLLFAEADSTVVVPELATFALLGVVNPCAVNLVPMLGRRMFTGWQANTAVAVVVVVFGS